MRGVFVEQGSEEVGLFQPNCWHICVGAAKLLSRLKTNPASVISTAQKVWQYMVDADLTKYR